MTSGSKVKLLNCEKTSPPWNGTSHIMQDAWKRLVGCFIIWGEKKQKTKPAWKRSLFKRQAVELRQTLAFQRPWGKAWWVYSQLHYVASAYVNIKNIQSHSWVLLNHVCRHKARNWVHMISSSIINPMFIIIIIIIRKYSFRNIHWTHVSSIVDHGAVGNILECHFVCWPGHHLGWSENFRQPLSQSHQWLRCIGNIFISYM